MTDETSEDERRAAYIASIQDQIMQILNGVKEEMGVDTPVEIEVREVSTDE
jgi:hypothetical protein